MELSPKLAAKFELLQNCYPVKRSALVPMMLYAQDEYGYISDDMVNELASRLDLRPVEVEETLAYYSMLHRKPVGKHHVQVCTNVACMLRGGAQLLQHRRGPRGESGASKAELATGRPPQRLPHRTPT